MALKREINALLPILTSPTNQDKTPEDLAEELIAELDALRARTHRLAVVVRHRWLSTDRPSVAVLGPFSTTAQALAKRAGEDACVRLTQPGSGHYALVPAFATARDAWEVLKPPSRAEMIRRKVAADMEKAERGLWARASGFHPTCCCGLGTQSRCLVHPKKET